MNAHGINVHFIADEYYENCAGLFQDPDLWIATKRSGWLGTYVHEYSHFLQLLDERDKKPLDYSFITDEEYEAWWTFTMGDKTSTPEDITSLRRKIQRMERDCDIRAHKLIVNNVLSVDPNEYMKRANCYHLFYSVIEKYARWYSKPPYENKKLIDMMPTIWLTDYETVPQEFERIVVAECFNT